MGRIIINESGDEDMGHYTDINLAARQQAHGAANLEEDYPIKHATWVGVPTSTSDCHTTFKTGAQKDVSGKPRFDLIPPEAMEALAQVYGLGARKYADRNWEKGIPFSAALGALKRHLNKFELGHNINTDDGDYEHMSHAMWWAVAIVTFLRRDRNDLNDLPAYKKTETKPHGSDAKVEYRNGHSN